MDVLHQLNADGHTVIIVTHDREVAQQAQGSSRSAMGRWSPTSHSARDNRDVQRLPAVQDNGRASLSRSIGESVRMAASLLGHRMRLSVDAGDYHRHLVRGFLNGGGGRRPAEHHERDWQAG
jgi:macrolide transport system ATP-binding/permease protein